MKEKRKPRKIDSEDKAIECPIFKIQLGQKVKHNVHGFTGIVIARTEWLNGCVVYGVLPEKMKENNPPETHHFDEQYLEVIKPKPVLEPSKARTGGPTRSVKISR